VRLGSDHIDDRAHRNRCDNMNKLVLTTEISEKLADFMGDLMVDIDYDADEQSLTVHIYGQCFTEAFEANRAYIEEVIGPIESAVQFLSFKEDYTSFKLKMSGTKITILVE